MLNITTILLWLDYLIPLMEQCFLLAAGEVSTVIPLQLGSVLLELNGSPLKLILLYLEQKIINALSNLIFIVAEHV